MLNATHNSTFANSTENHAIEALTKLDITIGTVYTVEAVEVMQLHVLCIYLMYTDKET
jgi:hypothetical protein